MPMRLLLLGASLLWLVACVPAQQNSAPSTPQPKVLHFMAGYKPQANLPFVAVYVAQTNGYFAQEGLQVDIQHASGNGEHLKLLLQGRKDVTPAPGDEALARRSEGLPVVSIAVLGQRNQRALAVRAESDIKTPKDWEGKLVGFKVEPAPEYLA